MDSLLTIPLENILITLFIVGVIAGIVDTIAGGGGLITIPALLLTGLPPLTALGTNRLQSSIGELTASLMFFLKGQYKQQGLVIGCAAAGLGALIGSYAISLISNDVLKVLIPILMGCIVIYTLFSPQLKRDKAVSAKMGTVQFMVIVGLVLGFYNGFFGPGTGTFWMIAFFVFLGLTLKDASISTKPLNFMGNLVSLFFFIGVGQINFSIGFAMGAGQIVGATIGGRLVITKGHKIVRPIFIMVTFLMSLKLLWDGANSGLFH